MLSAVVSGSSFALLAPWLAEKTIAAPYLAPMLQISAITVAMGIVNGVQTSSLDGCEAFQAKSYVSLVTGALQAVMVVFGAWAWGLKGSVAGLAASMMMTVAVTRWAVTKEWERFKIQPRWHEAKKEWRILLHFSLPTFLSLLTIGPAYWGGNALLANRPNGYAELGIFSAAIQWQGAIAFLPGLVCTAMIPIMSERIGAGDLQASLRLMWRMMGLIAIAVLPITILLWLASPMIMKGYGTNFTKGYWSLILLIATGTVGAIMTPIANFVASMGMMWKALAFNTGWIAMMFLGSLFMVRWGAEGLAGARFIAQVIQIVMYLLFVVRIQNNMRRNYLRSKQ
jgi:O-antigen/teichoic acid export membrane protein